MNSLSILIILILLASVFINTNIALAQNETGLIYNSSNHTTPSLLSPLKQFEAGIKSENVKCVTNFQLLIKENSGQPVCVKTSTISRLVTQGWILPHTIKVENTDYSIKYGINTGMLLTAVYDTTTNSVSLSVNTTNGGYLNVQLPRSFIDSKDKSGVDNIWSVIMNGKDIDYTEKKMDDSRILSFSFDDNTKKIVIIPYCSSFPC
ncbi:MAG: hypothetical protein KGL95_07655 [Patescibacteria group bacterium]|nr:hypothetical protein [Patescibacteria group bacterium]